MDIFHDPNRPLSTPAEAVENLSYELIRAFVAIGRLLGDEVGSPNWTPAAVQDELMRRLGRRLHDFVVVFGAEDVTDSLLLIAEAIDNLGGGEALDVDALAHLWHRIRS